MQVVPATPAGGGVALYAGGREHPLPGPLSTGVREFSLQGEREVHPAGPGAGVPVVLVAPDLQVPTQFGADCVRQHGHPVPIALPFADQDLPALEVHVLHPQAHAFHEPHSAPVQ